MSVAKFDELKSNNFVIKRSCKFDHTEIVSCLVQHIMWGGGKNLSGVRAPK